MGSVVYSGTDIEIRNDDGDLIWDVDRRPIQLLDEDAWLSVPLTISFPDFIKSFAHNYNQEDVGPPGFPLIHSRCMAFITVLGNEWGPDEAGGFNLADEVIGSVPDGVNYIDVRVTLDRTTSPSGYLGIAVPNNLPTAETFLPGGSMNLEQTPIWARAAEIVLDGTDVVLRRRQSTTSDTVLTAVASSDGTGLGWYLPAVTVGNFAFKRSSAGPSTGNKSYASGVCATNDTTDYSAEWTGTALIRPGYVKTS